MSNSRFDKLERTRSNDRAADEPKATPGSSLGRFEEAKKAEHPAPVAHRHGVAGDGPSPADAHQAMERFAADGTEGLRVERHDDGEQPFVRCPVCEHDWGRFDTRCGNCGEALDSQKARDFNAALWAQRLAEKKEADAGVAVRAQAQAAAVTEAAAEKRRYATLLAAEVKDRYDHELPVDDRSLLPSRWRYQVWSSIPFLVLLAFVSHGPLRWVFGAAALGFALSRLPSRVWRAFFTPRDGD